MARAKFANHENDSHAVKLDGIVSSNDFFTAPFGRTLDDYRKIQEWKEKDSVKSTHVNAKRKDSMKAVRAWVRDRKPKLFYAKWQSDSDWYKDDSVQIFFEE